MKLRGISYETIFGALHQSSHVGDWPVALGREMGDDGIAIEPGKIMAVEKKPERSFSLLPKGSLAVLTTTGCTRT
jgi:hypothetical protein